MKILLEVINTMDKREQQREWRRNHPERIRVYRLDGLRKKWLPSLLNELNGTGQDLTGEAAEIAPLCGSYNPKVEAD